MANQQHDLRVGIDFNPAKRDVRDFASYSANVQKQLATNVAAATRAALATGAGSTAGNQGAGALLANIRKQIPQVQRELERMFARLGHSIRLDPKALQADIDNLMSKTRKGFNRATVGGIPLFDPAGVPDPWNQGKRIIVPRQGQELGAIRQGYVDQTGANAASVSAQAMNMLQASVQARKDLLDTLEQEAARERANLGAMAADMGTTRAIAGQRVAIATLLRQQREIEARATTTAQFAQQSELTVAREKVATARNELALTLQNIPLVSKIAEERARLAAIVTHQANVEARALAAANLRLGLTARASNLGTAAITAVPSGPGTNLRNNPMALASLNQSIARSFTQTAVAAQKTTVAQTQTLTRFQRAYQYLHNQGAGRGGGPPTLGRFVGSRALSTAAFGLTGGLLYGGISAVRNMIKEASELQVQFGITESVFKEFSGTINGETFAEYKQNIIGISRDTGVAADELAKITRELSGAFATIDEQGTVTPNTAAGEQIGELAAQLSKITGLPLKEASDSFSASILAFTEDGEDATDIATRLGDAVVGLEARFGVGASEILNFTASLAPMASEMGFSLEQLAAFGAVVEQALGSDVAAAENMGRIFSGLADKIGPVAELLSSGGIDPSALVGAVAEGDLPKALLAIVDAYDQIKANPALKQQLGNLIAGERQARSFFAVLDRGAQIQSALGSGTDDFTGAQQKRWDEYQDTVVATFERMRRAAEEFGLALFDAGLVDALVALADAGSIVADAARLMLEAFGALNDLLGGLPAKLLVAAAAFKVLGLAGGFMFGGRIGGAGQMARTGAFLNPMMLGGISPLVAGRVTAPTGVRGYGTGGIPLAPQYIAPPVVDPRIGNIPRHMQPGARLPAKYGLRGLAAGNAGRLGMGLAGITSTIAPLAAGVAITALLSEVQNTAAEGDSARDQLREQVKTAIAEGTTPAEIRRNLQGRKGAENDFGTDVTNAVTSGFGLLGDSKNSYATAIDEVQKAEKAGLDQMLQKILDKGGVNEEDLESITTFMEGEGDNDDSRALIDGIIKRVREKDPKLAAAFDRILAEEEENSRVAKDQADAVKEASSGELEATTAEMEILFEKGEITLDRLVANYKKNAKIQRKVYQAFKGKDPAKALAALQEAIKYEEASLKAVETQFAQREQIIESLYGDDPTQKLALKREQFATTKDPKKRLELALDIRELQKAIIREEAEMADTAAEEIAILQAGFTPDASAAEILIAQVSQLDPVWVAFLKQTFGGVAFAADYIKKAAALAIEKGITFAEALATVIEQSIPANARASAAAMIERYRKSGMYTEEQLKQIEDFAFGAIEEVEGKADAVRDADLPDPGAGIDTDTEALDEAKKAQEKEDKAREAQALANALLDQEAARAEGNDLELARIARRRGEIALRFAETGSEKAAAIAQIMQADNQIRAALVAQTEAQRDLLVAKAHDSPTEAARIAVANARDALARAKGVAAQAAAQAALIRAESAQRDAIIDLADAQTDILIAQAEAAGNTVRAAQLALDKIRRQLARTDLNLQERRQFEAERISAEAAVRDARLAEERATIDYQLAIGQVTKGQAIASLQALLQIPKLTEEQIREINLAIKDLRSELGQDFQFNLPSQLALPTAYEVRRLGQAGGTGQSYQDNRTITVQVAVATDANPDQIASAVASAVGEPNRLGTYVGRY